MGGQLPVTDKPYTVLTEDEIVIFPSTHFVSIS
jgi:hypothetical protein